MLTTSERSPGPLPAFARSHTCPHSHPTLLISCGPHPIESDLSRPRGAQESAMRPNPTLTHGYAHTPPTLQPHMTSPPPSHAHPNRRVLKAIKILPRSLRNSSESRPISQPHPNLAQSQSPEGPQDLPRGRPRSSRSEAIQSAAERGVPVQGGRLWARALAARAQAGLELWASKGILGWYQRSALTRTLHIHYSITLLTLPPLPHNVQQGRRACRY